MTPVAEDITIFIRVRDATQGAIGRVTRDLGRLQTRLRAASNGRNVFDRIGDSLRRTQDHLRRSEAFVGRFRGALNRLGAAGLTPLARLSDGLGNRMRRVFGDASRAVGIFRGNLGRVGPMWSRLIAGARAFGDRIERSSRLTKIFLAIIALLGPAAQLAGALLITALGASFIALGAFALRGSAQVKNAFQGMKTTIGSVVREAAQPMEGALVGGMQQLAQAARVLQPLLTQAFTATAPLVKSVAGAVTDFAAGALPGMTTALQHAGPAMEGFRTAMGQVGQGIGDMFKKMTVGNEAGLANAWKLVGEELDNFLSNLGDFINTMTNSASATTLLLGVFRSFSGILHIVEAAFQAIDEVASPLFQKINGWVQGMSGLSGVSKQVAASFSYVGLSSEQLQQKLATVNQKIQDLQESYGNIKGPAKKGFMDKHGYSQLVAERDALEGAIAAAANGSASANANETKSINDLIDATRNLNEANRNNLDARATLEQSIDDADKKYTKYRHTLKMTNGQLDLGKQSQRDAYDLLSKIASATNDATKKAEDSKAPWEQVNAEWQRGHGSIAKLAEAMGLSSTEAAALADQLVKMPSPKVKFRMDKADATTDLNAFNAALKKTPNAHKVTLNALSESGEAVLAAFGLKIKRLPNGKVVITAKNGQALSAIASVQNAVNGLQGKSIGIGIYKTTYLNTVRAPGTAADGKKYPGVTPNAKGGLIRRFAEGGGVANIPYGGSVTGPGTGTSDSIPALLSNGEYVIRADSVRKYGLGLFDRINAGKYAKGGKVSKATQAERDAASQMRGQFGISYFGKIAGYTHTPYERNTALPQDLGSLVSALNDLRNQIKSAFHGSKEAGLLKQLTKAGKALISYEKKLTDVNKKLDAAKTKLSDLKQAAASLNDTVKSGVMTATDITQVATGEDKNITLSDVMAQMQTSVDKSTSFSKALSDLKSRGVSKDIINEIAQAGISGGGLETAGAILSGSDSDIANLNEMQKKINANAASAGKTAADAMYAAGIKAAQGLVDGLTKKQKDIEKAMMKIAKSMEKSLKKALGIKSPSRVMMQVGHHTAEGFALGIQKNRRVPNAWSSMLNVPSGAPTGGAQGGGSGVYTIPIYLGGKLFEEIVLDTNRRIVRTRGGDVQKVFGR
jgi:hypothetical protein